MNRSFHTLRVVETHAETDTATTFGFGIPQGLIEMFRWRPGQHVTLRFQLGGEELRRSYSISASPFVSDCLQITVKRVPGGRISNYINDNIQISDEIEIMPPFGGFCADPEARERRTYYFFAAGSGITPVMSMLESLLVAEPHSGVYLLYGNKDADSIIFKERLDDLSANHGERFTARYVLSRPSMWSSFRPWRKGHIDQDAIHTFIDAHPPYAQDAQYYVCGPGGMNAAVRSALVAIDVPGNRIHSESYGGDMEIDDTVRGTAATAEVTYDGATRKIDIASGETVLNAARRAGLHPPYSCESGVCGACRAGLTQGQVHMQARMALEDKEVAAGAILTCQSVPTTTQIALEYDT